MSISIQSLMNEVKINKLKSINYFQNILHYDLRTSIFQLFKHFHNA